MDIWMCLNIRPSPTSLNFTANSSPLFLESSFVVGNNPAVCTEFLGDDLYVVT